MHAAPSVTFPVGRSAWAARACALVGLLGLAAIAAWTAQASSFGWRQALGLAAVVACGSLAARDWRRSAIGMLRWDGVGWCWEEGALLAAGRPEIALDLQSRLLLRWHGEDSATRWLWLERHANPADWEALRRAVYSRASAPVPPVASGGREPPPAGQPEAVEQ